MISRRRSYTKSNFIGGPHSTLDSVLASHPAALGSNPGIPEIFPRNISFLRKIVDVAEVN